MRTLTLIAALVVVSYVFWTGWFVLFGSPAGNLRYVALASSLVLLRVGWHVFDRLLSKP